MVELAIWIVSFVVVCVAGMFVIMLVGALLQAIVHGIRDNIQ